jgi:hypothetical protein
MVADREDYREIDSLAVHREDVVSAFESNRAPGPRAVLRVTPPFAARERARLHVESDGEYTEDPRPLHVDPATLLDFEGVPAYPSATQTEDDLRADPDREYSIERHHTTHTDRVTGWREAVGEAILASAELDGQQGPHQVQVLALG